jgi:uncharacterized protein YcsI (UPF0317 family)
MSGDGGVRVWVESPEIVGVEGVAGPGEGDALVLNGVEVPLAWPVLSFGGDLTNSY